MRMLKKTRGPYSFVLFLAAALLSIDSTGQFRNFGTPIFISANDSIAIKGSFFSAGNISGSGVVVLNGDTDQALDAGGSSLGNLVLSSGRRINMSSPVFIRDHLHLAQGTKLYTGPHALTLGASATISGYNETSFIITGDSGLLTKQQLGPLLVQGFTFPVGHSDSIFAPLLVKNQGVSDDYSVRSIGSPPSSVSVSQSGPFANGCWLLSEQNPGGSQLSLTGGWLAINEPTGFKRMKSGLAWYKNNRWDLPASQVDSAQGQLILSQERTGIDQAGYFAVADSGQVNRALVQIRVFLQGAYSGSGTSAGLMRDQLRQNQVIPFRQPYNSGLYIHKGLQGGTEEVAASVFNNAQQPQNDIVDWVFVSLLDAQNPAEVIQTRSALLQRDGDIVDLDGQSPLSFPINDSGPYSMSIGHRNHLRVRTPVQAPLTLTDDQVSSWDFSSGNQQAYQNSAIGSNQPMIAVTQGAETRYCLIGGNTDGTGSVSSGARTVLYSGAGNDRNNILVNGLDGNPSNSVMITRDNYPVIGSFDLNMDGRIAYSGSGNDPLVILQAIGGNTSVMAREHH